MLGCLALLTRCVVAFPGYKDHVLLVIGTPLVLIASIHSNLHQGTTNAAQAISRARCVKIWHTIGVGATIALGVRGGRKVAIARGESGGRAGLPWTGKRLWYALANAFTLWVGDTIAGRGASNEEEKGQQEGDQHGGVVASV